ncbi:fungal cellulose binding domain-containing protein [Bisporella sp. PMI_857]|nr:fungal cellulose binding domain-containing protein [Bisporella sp. PMI_857]
MVTILACLVALAGAATAQQSVWGQCGGQKWSGPTNCVAGARSSPTGTTQIPTTTTTTRTTAAAQPRMGINFPKANGTRFTIDGVTKYFAGTNCYWCSVGGISNADVDLVFDHLQSSGLKILRVWGFNDVNSVPTSNQTWFQHLSASGSTINTGANGLQRLDYVVQAAERIGVKLIINFVNNWDDYGGIRAYTQAFGGTHQQWYTNTAAQAQYRRYIDAVVTRYRMSSAVFAWELANEPRCQLCSTDVIFNWAKTTSEYVKSLDSGHMVTLGDEGFGLPGDITYPYWYIEGVDFQRNLGIQTLDFGTFHLYPDHWVTTYTWGAKWISDHAALCAAANKPCLLEEYGTTSRHCELQRPWQVTSVGATGMGGDAFWQLGDTLGTGQTSDDRFTIFYNTTDWTCLVTNHVAAIG